MFAYFWDDPTIILFILLAVLIVDNLWGVYLLLREIRLVHKVDLVPEVIRMYISQDLFYRMRAYKLHKSWFTIVNTLIVVVICGLLELFFGFYAWLWSVACKCAFANWMEHEVVISIIFVIFLSIYMTLKSLPGQLYEKYCIPSLQKHIYPTWKRRVLKEIIDTVMALVLMMAAVSSIVFLIIWLGNYAFLALFVISILLTTILILLVPFLIDPFVGKRVPLENSGLRTELERLTDAVGFPMKQVHIIRVNDPNTGSNAFFYGSCCLKRIVIFDTLLLNRGIRDLSQLAPEDVGKGLKDAQVVAVVAHELGHWMHGHFYKAIAMFKIHLILSLLLFALCFNHGPIYQAVGFEEGLQPIIVGFIIIFAFVLTPYMTLANFLMLLNTRHFEYQADSFAYELGYARDLRLALLKLYADNLSFPISDPCYSMWNHTHPTMLDRLERLEEMES